jgi:TolB-like protein/DNA-binding winged helix-turn-helix (wHTH) protein/Flp pilus assembly protein TadD
MPLRFGVFEVDLRAGELRKNGARVRLQEQPLQVLAMLLEHAGEVVSREDLQKRLWPAETFVDFDHGLNKTINKIREALGDSAQNPRFVETVARRGYRFLADVIVVEQAPIAEAAPPPPPAVEAAPVALPAKLPSWLPWAGAVLALLLLALGGLKIHAWSQPPPAIHSLAVLPLESLSNDASQDYFADGMTDELISDLAQISALRVISRTSVMAYKHAGKSLPQIARELAVDAVVEGTVLRSGDRVRITAQLIDAAADKHLWSQSYEGELRDTLALQNKVARAIADEIRITLNPQEAQALKTARVVNPAAYEAYLQGRYFWNKRTADSLKAALAHFNDAIGQDPSYAQAYSGLADTYALLGDWEYAVMPPREALPKAKAAAVKALELDGRLGEAHNSLAFCLDVYGWDFDQAGKEFQRAIELNPGYATAHHWYAWHLALTRRNEDALAEMRKAASLDPLSLIIKADAAELLLIARDYEESMQQSRKTLEMDPSFALGHHQLGQAYLQTKDYGNAVLEMQKAVQLSGGSATSVANLARAYVAAGRRPEAEQQLAVLKSRSTADYPSASEIAMVYVALGDPDQAMSWLDKGFQSRFNPSVLLRPGFDPLRSDPRFQSLLHRIGLPQ